VRTVSPETGATQAAGPRALALKTHAEALGTDGDAADAVALGLVDATLAGDGEALRAALQALRHVEGGAGEALSAVAQWALERLPGDAEAALVAPGTHAWRFLRALDGGPLGGGQVRDALGTDETQVSRLGRQLLDAGLVTRRKAGRQVTWDLSPRGRRALDDAGDPGPPRRPGGGGPGSDMEWWRQMIRDAWHGDIRHGDATDEQIIEATFALHHERGVPETTWAEIAARSGVPIETVTARYPTLEDLVPACGGLAMGRLRMPPPGEAEAALFAGQDPHERLRTLVDYLFDLYEHAAPAITTARRDGDRVPMVGYSRDATQEALDGVIAAGVGDARLIGPAKALLDLPVWRAVRAEPGAREVLADALEALLPTPRS
jgi:AcrR family transcriptional regulator